MVGDPVGVCARVVGVAVATVVGALEDDVLVDGASTSTGCCPLGASSGTARVGSEGVGSAWVWSTATGAAVTVTVTVGRDVDVAPARGAAPVVTGTGLAVFVVLGAGSWAVFAMVLLMASRGRRSDRWPTTRTPAAATMDTSRTSMAPPPLVPRMRSSPAAAEPNKRLAAAAIRAAMVSRDWGQDRFMRGGMTLSLASQSVDPLLVRVREDVLREGEWKAISGQAKSPSSHTDGQLAKV